MNLLEERKYYIDEGLNINRASTKVCLDIFLYKLARSKYINNVTIKGGTVMQNISDYVRRSTKDIDFDFIHYSLSEDAIRKFINDLNIEDDDITIEIIGSIKDANQQDYHGKRVKIVLKDKYGNKINGSFDVGVQSDSEIVQNDIVFFVGKDKQKVTLLANSIEQIFVEKLKSLLKHNIRTTRYKDIYDFYYLINEQPIDKQLLKIYINKYILEDNKLKYKTIDSIAEEVDTLLNDDNFKLRLSDSIDKWIDLPIDEITFSIINFLKTLI